MVDRTALFTESFRLTSLTAIKMLLLSKQSPLNSKAGTHLHPQTRSWFSTDSEEKSRRIPRMLQFLALALNARKVNHCFKPCASSRTPDVSRPWDKHQWHKHEKLFLCLDRLGFSSSRTNVPTVLLPASRLTKQKLQDSNYLTPGNALIPLGLKTVLDLLVSAQMLQLTSNFRPDFVLPLI